MGRYVTDLSPDQVRQRLAEGRGKGLGKDYHPFLTVRDVPSQGVSYRIHSPITGRVHHLLSTGEAHYLMILNLDPRVRDIREQFPLPLDVTTLIAADLRIRHPQSIKYKSPCVMTTDFVITRTTDAGIKTVARALKMSEDLEKDRTKQKLRIDYEYWTRQGVDWAVVDIDAIPKGLRHNAVWLYTYITPDDLPPRVKPLLGWIQERLVLQSDLGVPLVDACTQIDRGAGLKPGDALNAAKHLIASRRIRVDLTQKIETRRPLQILRPEIKENAA